MMIAAIFGFNVSLNAASSTSIATPFGNWSSSNTWNSPNSPSSSNCVDTINIDEQVYVSTQIDLTNCSVVIIYVSDTLRFKSGAKLDLPANSLIATTSTGYIIPEGTSGSSNQISIGGVTIWITSDGVIGPSTFLPVTLLSFEAERTKDGILISWETATEHNNSHYNIYLVTNQGNRNLIHREPGRGNTQNYSKYTYIHTFRAAYDWVFELEQVDFNGNKKTVGKCLISEKIHTGSIDITSGSGYLSVNSVDEEVYLDKIEIIGPSGRLLSDKCCNLWLNGQGIRLNTNHIGPGIVYVSICSHNQQLMVKKMALW